MQGSSSPMMTSYFRCTFLSMPCKQMPRLFGFMMYMLILEPCLARWLSHQYCCYFLLYYMPFEGTWLGESYAGDNLFILIGYCILIWLHTMQPLINDTSSFFGPGLSHYAASLSSNYKLLRKGNLVFNKLTRGALMMVSRTNLLSCMSLQHRSHSFGKLARIVTFENILDK